jgi:hypothetical protein
MPNQTEGTPKKISPLPMNPPIGLLSVMADVSRTTPGNVSRRPQESDCSPSRRRGTKSRHATTANVVLRECNKGYGWHTDEFAVPTTRALHSVAQLFFWISRHNKPLKIWGSIRNEQSQRAILRSIANTSKCPVNGNISNA